MFSLLLSLGMTLQMFQQLTGANYFFYVRYLFWICGVFHDLLIFFS